MILVNGKPSDGVSPLDRGLAFGDGLFETVAVTERGIRNWNYHWRRFSNGCERLGLPLPDQSLVMDEILAVTANQASSVAKFILTRGSGGAAYTAPTRVTPTRIVSARPWPHHYAERATTGITLTLAIQRLSHNAQLAGIKHLNRLEQVLASEAIGDNTHEALMLDQDAYVVEATRCNLFVVKSGKLLIPMIDRCGVAGVMREIVLERAAVLQLPIEHCRLRLEDLVTADEIFLTNAVAGIWPVITLVGEHAWSAAIGDITLRLQRDLSAAGFLK